MFIPDGFTTVTPYIFVDDADAFATFLKTAFNAREVQRTMRPDGGIANLQLAIGNAMLMVSEANDSYPSMPAAYYIYVENADAAMQSAIAAGGLCEMAVADMDYGDRQGGIRDPFGNIWWVSQRLVDEPYHG